MAQTPMKIILMSGFRAERMNEELNR